MVLQLIIKTIKLVAISICLLGYGLTHYADHTKTAPIPY